MFIALDKSENQGHKQALVVVPERAIGSHNGSKADAVKAFLAPGANGDVGVPGNADVLVGMANGKAKDKAGSD